MKFLRSKFHDGRVTPVTPVKLVLVNNNYNSSTLDIIFFSLETCNYDENHTFVLNLTKNSDLGALSRVPGDFRRNGSSLVSLTMLRVSVCCGCVDHSD